MIISVTQHADGSYTIVYVRQKLPFPYPETGSFYSIVVTLFYLCYAVSTSSADFKPNSSTNCSRSLYF